jgi:microsomal epoxide hydrolase
MKLGRIIPLLLLTCAVSAAASDSREIQSRYFTTSDGVSLHYLDSGAGPTLVFIPGWTMPAEVWDFQIRHFSATHRVVALDPRGHGRSEKVAHGYYPSRRGQDIAEFLDHLGGEPAVIVSWSLGVHETLVSVQESGTEGVRGLVLVDWDLVVEEPERFTSRFVSLQVEREEWTRQFIEVIFLNPPSEEYLEAMTQSALSVPTNAAAIMIGNIILMAPYDTSPVVDSLDRPALFVYSSLGWAVEAADDARRRWPDANVEVVADTSHALFVDQPQAFNRLLGEFLEALPKE